MQLFQNVQSFFYMIKNARIATVRKYRSVKRGERRNAWKVHARRVGR